MQHYPVLVAIETDPTRYHGEHPRRPGLLNRGAAEQMLAHLASDLATLFPDLYRCHLAMPGALYDQTQVLQPGYPIYAALESCAKQGARAGYQDRLVSIGADQGRMPLSELQPASDVVPALLQVLPLLVSAPAEQAGVLFDDMEHRFLEQGQVSAHSAKGLEAAFGIGVNHARFMTLTDLNAMLHLQLEHFGFAALWKLLDAALERQPDPFLAAGRHGTVFRWDGRRVLCRFETYDHWASHGAGRKLAGEAAIRSEGYRNWTREYRQYLVTLGAHAVPVAQHLPESTETLLEESFLVEVSAGRPRERHAQVTEHSAGDLGTVAVTVADGGRLLNFYPLRAEGLNDLHAHLRAAGLAKGGVSFPGSICLDRGCSRLAQDRL